MTLRFIPSVDSNLNEIDSNVDPPSYNSTVTNTHSRRPRRSRHPNSQRQSQGTQILTNTLPEIALITNEGSSRNYLELCSVTRSRRIIEEDSQNKVIYNLGIGGAMILIIITTLITGVFAALIFAL